MKRLAKLPALLGRKIYKTGQTRGADDDEIYQNRVGRNSTILIPFSQFPKYSGNSLYGLNYEKGFIVLVNPSMYFEQSPNLQKLSLVLGENALLFYETRDQWNAFNPMKRGLAPASSRKSPLGGEFVARVPATTAANGGDRIHLGFSQTENKGAGIRAYEYASSDTINKTKCQLEAIFWLCKDALPVVIGEGMEDRGANSRKAEILGMAQALELLNYEELIKARILNGRNNAVCPLCLEEMSGRGFFTRLEQAEGREVVDLTVTSINLFHIEELRFGDFNHRPYNLGWGHHHCNVVVRDKGIERTLEWMGGVLARNRPEMR
jgi:hypothetical protein